MAIPLSRTKDSTTTTAADLEITVVISIATQYQTTETTVATVAETSETHAISIKEIKTKVIPNNNSNNKIAQPLVFHKRNSQQRNNLNRQPLSPLKLQLVAVSIQLIQLKSIETTQN